MGGLRACQWMGFFLMSVRAFDSRNISAGEWECSGGVSIAFTGSAAVTTCGGEVLQSLTGAMPTITYSNSSDALSALYTVLIVDRDAPSAASPIRSPLRHMALGNVSASMLASGLDAAAVAAAVNGSGLLAYFPYSGPQPPAGSLCHRYYVQIYRQLGGAPVLAVNSSNPTDRLLFDFPVWASANNLTKEAVSFWRTQNFIARIGGCDGDAPAASSIGLAVGLGVGIGVPILALLAVMLAVPRLRPQCLHRGAARNVAARPSGGVVGDAVVVSPARLLG